MKKEQQEDGSRQIPLSWIVLIMLLVFASFIVAYQCLPLIKFKLLTDSFNKIAVGLAALLAVVVGQNWVVKEEMKEKKIKEYIKKYPHDKFGIDWKIVEPKSYLGAYYVFETKSKTVHHILNMKTVYDLGWHVYLNLSEKIEDSLFRSYTVGDRIRTQGEAGE